ncbi:hypothetical protein [Litorihabitans aurantiacus]|uniref:Tetratricopeptide repeat protein n=1 Tax=Litorihabitans aurantiacus TaxID=1930061 RepID=A0AA37UP00_9MICO|nr:hypothetical protein [Litorihabitans aurantiacus]GMA30401.1 hypothetical protein GCM10025875_03930 [Litorihabitans aurantiacus]
MLGYLEAHRDAVDILDDALAEFPGDGLLLGLRGVKRLIARDHDGARADLEAAAVSGGATEPEVYREEVTREVVNDLLGRSADTPLRGGNDVRITTGVSTWHHLGVARYVGRDFGAAAAAFRRAREESTESGAAMAALDWEYLALTREGRESAASAVLAELDGVDLSRRAAWSGMVARLASCYEQRLRMYRGELGPEALLRNDTADPLAIATLGYGVASHYRVAGYDGASRRALERVVRLGDSISSAYIAAEVDLDEL